MLIQDILPRHNGKQRRAIPVTDMGPYPIAISVSYPLKVKPRNYTRLQLYANLTVKSPAVKNSVVPQRVRRTITELSHDLLHSTDTNSGLTISSNTLKPERNKRLA